MPDYTDEVLRDVEAQRATTAEPHLEDGLSIKDWVDRIRAASINAAMLARQENDQLQYEAWVELAAIVVGRAEQVLRLGEEVGGGGDVVPGLG